MDGFQREIARVRQRVRQLRQHKGFTQNELREKSGVFDVGELERGYKRGYKVKGAAAVNLRVETLSRIASVLDVSLEELFGHSIPDETVKRIRGRLEGQDSGPRQQPMRIVQVLVVEQ